MEGLEDDADAPAAKDRQSILAHARQVDALDQHLALVSALQPGHDHQQARLARAGRPDKADRFTGLDGQRDPLQDMDARGVAPQTEFDIFQFNQGGHDRSRNLSRNRTGEQACRSANVWDDRSDSVRAPSCKRHTSKRHASKRHASKRHASKRHASSRFQCQRQRT